MFNERNVGVKTKTLRLLWRKKTEFLIKIQETNTRNVHIVYSRSWIHKTKKKKKKKKKKEKKRKEKKKEKRKRKRNKNFYWLFNETHCIIFTTLYKT